MDIKILDSWLREYLDTYATPQKISEYLSLCGPSVERIEKLGSDHVYDIEVTTNRIDCASVYGIAREASAILPRFKVRAKLKRLSQNYDGFNFVNSVDYLSAKVDTKLCQRFSAVLIKNVNIGDSPEYIRERLESAGVRALNNIVDISNYIMISLGQPVHTFDYDKIKGAKMVLRESRKGEKITTLDGKEFALAGGDIVIEDGEGRLIDLAGVMGGDLSAVDEKTKNVLLFVQTYNPINIRKTSMYLAQRTVAATIFEKGTDTELVGPGILTGIALFEKLTGGKAEKNILNIYPAPYKAKKIDIKAEYITKLLGISIPKNIISEILNSLEFETNWHGETLSVLVPSFRARDFYGPEDVLEEIARIYGYHNFPSKLMEGDIPTTPPEEKFVFEQKIKNLISGWGGTETYTLSLVSRYEVSGLSLKLKNPLGAESEYLRTSLMPSLRNAAKENSRSSQFHLFEMSNIYIPKKNDLPKEKMTLAGIMSNYKFVDAKGIIEALLTKLGIGYKLNQKDLKGFSPGKSLIVDAGQDGIGNFGILENSNLIYYELDMEKLLSVAPSVRKYVNIPKYPPQIEDITLLLPEKTRVGDLISAIEAVSRQIAKVELKDTFKDSYTFNIEYQDPSRTLTDSDVEKIRTEVLKIVKNKFGATVKT